MNKKKGFTLIEVALVLGLAAGIFLMAFLALPTLWISERDADRKARVMEFVSDIKTYQTNNSRGALPSISGGKGPLQFNFGTSSSDFNTWQYLVANYVAKDFVDGSGNPYKFYIVSCLSASGTELSAGATCAYPNSGANAFGVINKDNNIDVKMPVISEGGKEYYMMYVAMGAICDGDHAVKANSPRDVAVVQVLERNGRYCHNT